MAVWHGLTSEDWRNVPEQGEFLSVVRPGQCSDKSLPPMQVRRHDAALSLCPFLSFYNSRLSFLFFWICPLSFVFFLPALSVSVSRACPFNLICLSVFRSCYLFCCPTLPRVFLTIHFVPVHLLVAPSNIQALRFLYYKCHYSVFVLWFLLSSVAHCVRAAGRREKTHPDL